MAAVSTDSARTRATGEVESMRKVVAYTLVSVDGVAEDPDQFLFDFDKVMEANLAEVIGTQDTVLLGRKMYDEWSNYWPKSDDQPFAGLVDELRLIVAPRVVGGGRRLFEDDVAHILELVQSTGSPSGSLLVHYNVVTGSEPEPMP